MVSYGWVDPHDRDLLRRLAIARSGSLLGVCRLLHSVYASDTERGLLTKAEDHILEARSVLKVLFAEASDIPRQETIF